MSVQLTLATFELVIVLYVMTVRQFSEGFMQTGKCFRLLAESLEVASYPAKSGLLEREDCVSHCFSMSLALSLLLSLYDSERHTCCPATPHTYCHTCPITLRHSLCLSPSNPVPALVVCGGFGREKSLNLQGSFLY